MPGTEGLSPACFGWILLLAFAVQHLTSLVFTLIDMFSPAAVENYSQMVETSGPDGILFCMVPEYADPSAVDRRDHFPGAAPWISEKDGNPVSGCEFDPGCVFRHLSSEFGAGDLHGASGIPARISGSEIRDIDRTDVPALPL